MAAKTPLGMEVGHNGIYALLYSRDLSALQELALHQEVPTSPLVS